ncbi:MAG TPA: hypothetical protein VH325_04435 [Bryobacteraceae bacterium]|jgi:hypothetical protein|nr:hypothetical protein [Bryobacteraceae bacterium]
MALHRRAALAALLSSALPSPALDPSGLQPPEEPPTGFPPVPKLPDEEDRDRKLPNGKSQKDAIAKQEHEAALKDANELIAMAQQLKEQLVKAGDYVVPVASVKKTEDIEKLARKIRGRLNR